VNTIEVPLTFVTAGLVGLGGLALLMGAALSSLAELLALMPGRGGWVGSGAGLKGRGMRLSPPRPRAGALAAIVLPGQDGCEALIQHRDGAKGPDVDDSQAGSVISIVTEVRRPLSLHGEVSKPE
jgi:hypothetical protein